jgi:hypothetical protein
MDTTHSIIRTLSEVQTQISRHCAADDADLLNIRRLIQLYMDTHCKHHIVYDYVDIPPEGGHSIRFCDVCMKTFD